MPSSVDVDWAGHAWQLLPDRALRWPARRTLIVADLHFGKSDLFRAHGLPVPSGATQNDLLRLAALLGQHADERLLILGDFFHGKLGVTDELLDQLRAWRAAHAALAVTLVRGNHDRSAGDPCPSLGIDTVATLHESGVDFAHVPPTEPATPTLAGHVHPGARLADFDGSGVTVPAFVFEPTRAVLPAFGKLTGTAAWPAGPDTRLFAAAAGSVVEVAPEALVTARRYTSIRRGGFSRRRETPRWTDGG